MIQTQLEKLKDKINSFIHSEKMTNRFNKVLKTIHYPEEEKLEDYSISQVINLRKRSAMLEREIATLTNENTQEIKIKSTKKSKKKKQK